jgi:protein subunit release factor A
MASGNKRKLFSVGIKDCKVDTFTVGGNGGAGKDTSNTGVRVSHLPSGAMGVCVASRSQLKNKQTAFQRMAESKEFQLWAKLKAYELATERSIEELVDVQMNPKNLKIEYRTETEWKTVPAEEFYERQSIRGEFD